MKAQPQVAKPRLAPGGGAARVRRMALLGNVNVGKSTLFDRLCEEAEHGARVVGSAHSVRWGVLAVGPGAAPRLLRARCSQCRLTGACAPAPAALRRPCPVLDVSARRPAFWRRRLSGFAVPAAEGGVDGRPVATHLFDAPGCATLMANGEEEIIARDLLLSTTMDGVVLVADAKSLRRSLALALEVAELGLPMVFNLNMVDEALASGIEIDDAELTRALGVPVNRTVATENLGAHKLAELVLDAQPATRRVRYPEVVESSLRQFEAILANPTLSARALGLLLLTGDEGARAWIGEHLGPETLAEAEAVAARATANVASPLRLLIGDAIHRDAGAIADRVVTSRTEPQSGLARFGNLAQRPVAGALLAGLVLVLAYAWVGVVAARWLVDAIDLHLIRGFAQPLLQGLVAPIPLAFVRDAIMDPDFGLLPSGLFPAFGVVFPVLFAFYLLQTVLEDSGYLPRLAMLCDRMFRRVGFTGQGLIPLSLGFSCGTMAIITARLLPTRKERIILTLLVAGVPCAPLLVMMMVLLSAMPWTASAFVLGLVALRIVVFGFAAAKILPGKTSDLILQIPRMRIPHPGGVVRKAWWRTRRFMREAVPVFLLASLAVFVFAKSGGLHALSAVAAPVVQGLLGLPEAAVQVLVKTAIRRENGATELGLLRAQFTNLQMVTVLLIMTFVMPCINATAVIVKERGLKASIAILAVVVTTAVGVGAAVSFFCNYLGVTFTS